MKTYPELEKFYSELGGIHGISCGLHTEDLRFLLEALEELKPNSNYVEIGVSESSSILAASKFRPDINCYGVEIESGERALGNIQRVGEGKLTNIELIFGDSTEVCKTWDKEIDLLFIDGNHTFPQIFYDFVGWYPYVKKGSKIIFHDYETKESLPRYQIGLAAEVFKNHPKYKCYIPSIDDNISTSMVIITKP